jgi:hypothetical protein
MGGDPDPAKNDPQARVMASVRAPGGAFAAPVNLGEGDYVWDYAPVIAPDGSALLVYTHMQDRYYTVRIARADTHTASVGGATDVGYGASPRIALASDGTGVVMWLGVEREHWAIQSRWLSGSTLGPLREMGCDEGNGNPWLDQLIATPGDHAATVSNGSTWSAADAMLLKETHVARTSQSVAPAGRCPHPIPTPEEKPPPKNYAADAPAQSPNAAEQVARRVIDLLPKATIDRKGRLGTSLRADRPGTYRITGSVRQGKRTLRLRSKSGRTRGRRTRVVLRMAGRGRLARGKRAVARLTVAFVDAGGKAYVSRQTIRVR